MMKGDVVLRDAFFHVAGTIWRVQHLKYQAAWLSPHVVCEQMQLPDHYELVSCNQKALPL